MPRRPLRDFRESLDFSPEEYDGLETRLSLINRLERKYGREADAFEDYLRHCRARLDDIEYSDDRIAKLSKELEYQKKRCLASSEKLSLARKKARGSCRDALSRSFGS